MDFLTALDTIENVSDETILSHREEIQKAFRKFRSILTPTSSLSVVMKLEAVKLEIKKYFKLSAEEAISLNIDWHTEDPRLLDIRLGHRQRSPRDSFRKGLGQRSFALQLNEWHLQKFGITKIDDPLQSKTNGRIGEFLKDHEIPCHNWIVHEIKHGLRLLKFERDLGIRGISACLFFVHSAFRSVKHKDFESLVFELEQSDWIETAGEKTEWLDECQSRYNGQRGVLSVAVADPPAPGMVALLQAARQTSTAEEASTEPLSLTSFDNHFSPKDDALNMPTPYSFQQLDFSDLADWGFNLYLPNPQHPTSTFPINY
ncbi:hypothetical protein UCRPC4_g06753 [Phaeomoniella chlamydospora]|uniref:Uncharacterized protein n=1 Tax=Phaeomoniella chlamydospora TaxID=158046 RepID=A0A0G2DW81_PHACM|nr:hypothetical protein UCRPC4_g06753 [Phaeomoniella chlamydospora]